MSLMRNGRVIGKFIPSTSGTTSHNKALCFFGKEVISSSILLVINNPFKSILQIIRRKKVQNSKSAKRKPRKRLIVNDEVFHVILMLLHTNQMS